MNFVFTTRNVVPETKDFCIKNEEICINNDGFRSSAL